MTFSLQLKGEYLILKAFMYPYSIIITSPLQGENLFGFLATSTSRNLFFLEGLV